ncbi:hypothetical protein DB31_0998 [Hyalangium minutum]|uniref:Uncharacterized protein n=1 Tax=Hyalangium minutum TaxID=394096 RepID=A0A085WFR2_9BACT|nr:hypothetical protein DB31_0998 [Hyalangium minutum]
MAIDPDPAPGGPRQRPYESQASERAPIRQSTRWITPPASAGPRPPGEFHGHRPCWRRKICMIFRLAGSSRSWGKHSALRK